MGEGRDERILEGEIKRNPICVSSKLTNADDQVLKLDQRYLYIDHNYSNLYYGYTYIKSVCKSIQQIYQLRDVIHTR